MRVFFGFLGSFCKYNNSSIVQDKHTQIYFSKVNEKYKKLGQILNKTKTATIQQFRNHLFDLKPTTMTDKTKKPSSEHSPTIFDFYCPFTKTNKNQQKSNIITIHNWTRSRLISTTSTNNTKFDFERRKNINFVDVLL